MNIEDYIKELNKRNIISNTVAMKKWWCKECIEDGSWLKMEVNFYTLFIEEPLYKFNEMYTKWYRGGNGGSMGDFLEDTPTDTEIIDYLDGKEIDFSKHIAPDPNITED